MPTLKGILEALFWMVISAMLIVAVMIGFGWGGVPVLGPAAPALIDAAERIGRLPHALRRLVQQHAMRSSVDATDAVFLRAYPFVMTLMMALSISTFAMFVMPKYETIFRDFGTKL